METTLTSKGQLTLPKEVRDALGLDAGTVLDVEIGRGGSVVLRKKAVPGFFNRFAGLKAADAPYLTGDAAREALRIEEDPGRYEPHPAPNPPAKDT